MLQQNLPWEMARSLARKPKMEKGRGYDLFSDENLIRTSG